MLLRLRRPGITRSSSLHERWAPRTSGRQNNLLRTQRILAQAPTGGANRILMRTSQPRPLRPPAGTDFAHRANLSIDGDALPRCLDLFGRTRQHPRSTQRDHPLFRRRLPSLRPSAVGLLARGCLRTAALHDGDDGGGGGGRPRFLPAGAPPPWSLRSAASSFSSTRASKVSSSPARRLIQSPR